MKIKILWIGKTSETWMQAGLDEYAARLKHYLPYSIDCIVPKNLPKQDAEKQKAVEGDALLARIEADEQVYLLDERGKAVSSPELADFFQQKMLSGLKTLTFAIGGPFGFSDKVYARADGMLSFSKLTFSHQMIRLLLLEQTYRAMTILRGESYHHG